MATLLRRALVEILGAVTLLTLVTSCGGGPSLNRAPDNSSGSADGFQVKVSAGGPVSGAMVTVYAIGDDGSVNTLAGNQGVLGSGGPTDENGAATITVSAPAFSGPIQVVAGGAAASYPDPTIPVAEGQTPAVVQIPAAFSLSSYVTHYTVGENVTVPVTLLTTLADHEALAYAKGRHPKSPNAKSIARALIDRDQLFVQHITTSQLAWDPASLRKTIPTMLTAGKQTLVDSAYAALFDLALNQLAHDTAKNAGYGYDSTAVTAVTLVQLLEKDVDADGVFDGLTNGTQIVIEGATPLKLNSQFLRIPLAEALNKWIQTNNVNASGITQGDLVSGGVFVAISQDRSDLFGEAPEGIFNPTDRVAPELAFTTTPPQYIKSADKTMALKVAASDPSGVAGVYCKSNIDTSLQSATQEKDGSWTCNVTLASNGVNQYSIWGTDKANPSNSGQSLIAPYSLSGSITVDVVAPTPTLVSTPCYYDERGVTLAMNGNVAATPAIYQYTNANKVSISANGEVYKVASRLGWNAAAPSAALLEGDNPDNIPFLQYSIPFDAARDAPIVSATYKVTIAGQPDATRDLWPSAKTESSVLYYDLPLASNLVPALASVSGTANLSVTLTLTDAAGNVAPDVSGGSFTFHVMGPPLGVAEDVEYGSSGDNKSTYPYSLGAQNYYSLYDKSSTMFLPENSVRLARYIVTNPSSSPVALSLPNFSTSSWVASEDFSAGQAALANTQAYQLDPPGLGACGLPISPCAGVNSYYVYVPPDNGAWQCGVQMIPAGHIGPVQVATSALSLIGYYLQNGSAVSVPSLTAGGRYIVPPASGASPGVLGLYVTRPLNTSRNWKYTSTYPYRRDLGHQYTVAGEGMTHCSSKCLQKYLYTGYYSDLWYYFELTTASESFSGQFQLQSYGLNDAGTGEIGEAANLPQTVTIDKTVAH